MHRPFSEVSRLATRVLALLHCLCVGLVLAIGSSACIAEEPAKQPTAEKKLKASREANLFRANAMGGLYSELYRYFELRDNPKANASYHRWAVIRASPITTTTAALKAVWDLEDASGNLDDDHRAAYRVIALVFIGRDVDQFARRDDPVWVIRQATSDLKTINQFWVNARNGAVLQALPQSNAARAAPSAAAIDGAVQKICGRLYPGEEQSEFMESMVFAERLPEYSTLESNAIRVADQDRWFSELAHYQVATRRDAYALANTIYLEELRKQKRGRDSSTRARVKSLLQLAVDVPDFAKQDDLIWVTVILNPDWAVEQEYWINARTGQVRPLFDHCIVRTAGN